MPKAKLKAEDYEEWLGSAQMWKHEALAEYIQEQTEIKLDPVEVALVIALRPEWRTSKAYFSMLDDRRSGVESKRREVQKPRSRKSVEQDDDAVEEKQTAKPKKVKVLSKKAKVKQQQDEEESPRPRGKKGKVKKSKKATRSTAAEETIFDD